MVTGAASGIGKATALTLAQQGCHLALVDVNKHALESTAKELKAQQTTVSAHVIDVSNPEQMTQLVQEVIEQHHEVHILVNNAGVVTLGNFEDQSYKDLEWLIGINLWGVIHGCKLFLPYLKQVEEAHIVNIASAAAIYAAPKRSSYALSKFAVRGLSESLRHELAAYNIGVSCIYPGIIRTNIGKATRMVGESNLSKPSTPPATHVLPPEKVAEKVVKAIQGNKARMLIGRESYVLDIGQRLLPTAFSKWLTAYLEQ